MAEPFVFHFRRGSQGQPEVMYIADLKCHCGLCQHVEFQRYYHATAFHSLTLKKLDMLAESLHEKADYSCENCGTEVTSQDVQSCTLTYGFADDAGIIRIFVDREKGEKLYQLIPRRRLDPQEHPSWTPDPQKGAIYPYVDDSLVEDVLLRPINAKLVWQEVLDDWLEDPEGGAYTCVGPGFWIVTDASEEMAHVLSDDIGEQEFSEAHDQGEFFVVNLCDSVPRQLPTHKYPEHMPGRLSTWLSESTLEALEEGHVWAQAHMSRILVIETMKRAFDTARLSYQFDVTEADAFFSQITTPGEGVYGKGVPVSSVLRRAVYTGMMPGEAARLTAEEIIGVLLRVWNPE